MVVFYSTPEEAKQQMAEAQRYARRRRQMKPWWVYFDENWSRIQREGELREAQMAALYGWNKADDPDKPAD